MSETGERRLKIGVITASTRQKRMGEKVARWVLRVAAERPQFELVPIDLRDLALPTYDDARSPKLIGADYASETQRKWVELVGSLDGFIVVTPEYNHGYPAALKNALDTVYAGWNGKPMAFVSYGGPAGGVRAVEQLRLVAVELLMAPLRDEVNVALMPDPFDADGNMVHPLYLHRIVGLLDGLEWWATALAAERAKRPLPVAKPPPRK